MQHQLLHNCQKYFGPTQPKLMSRPLFLLIGLTTLFQATNAQDSVADSTYSKAAYNNAVTSYHKYTDKQARLYNGFLHIGYSNKIEGVAYWPDNTWQKGSVVYDGVYFPDVSMLFDIYKDELVILHFHRLLLTLHNEKVKEFTFGNYHFVRIQRDSSKHVTLNAGFYQQMYKSNNITLLGRRVKLLEETITDVLIQKFIPKNFYYINRNNTWYAVKTYGDLRDILKEKSKEIKQHLKKNKVRWRKDRERALVLAVQYFDAITQ
jgi:hypothetical protein